MIGGSMDKDALLARLVRPGRADEQECRKLSANKFIAEVAWRQLASHERYFLRAYASGTAAHKAVLIGRSAAAVLGMWILPAADDLVTLANPAQTPPRKEQWPAGVEYRAMRIPLMDILIITQGSDQLRTMNQARTAVDIARMYGVRHGVVAMDSLFHQAGLAGQAMVRAELEACIKRLAGKKGIGHARQALAWCSARSESPYESLLRVILRERRIVVEEQMWIGRFARTDMLWGQLVIEIDGAVKFNSDDATGVALDQTTRENWIRVQNYDVARVTPGDILRDEEGVVRQIVDLKRRSELLGEPRVPATVYRPQHGEDWRRR